MKSLLRMPSGGKRHRIRKPNSSSLQSIRNQIFILAPAIAALFLFGLATEADARGRGGGGMRHGGGMARGSMGASRGGPARGGSIRHERSGGGYRSYEGGGRQSRAQRTTRDHRYDGNIGREGALRRPATGERRDTADRDRATGRERPADRVGTADRVRPANPNQPAAGTRTRTTNGGTTRSEARQTWREGRCGNSRCYGGRVRARHRYYYRHPYYYYPYYYGWYSCPIGSTTTWYNRYGTPVYGCSNVVVVHTTIVLGSTDTGYLAAADSKAFASEAGPKDSTSTDARPQSAPPREAEVSSAPVLMYEETPEVVVYATPYRPTDVHSTKHGDYYFWVPGVTTESSQTKLWTATAVAMKQPTANSTVITYSIEGQTVYLTNEPPAPRIFSGSTDQLFVWIPGVEDPSEEEQQRIAAVIDAHSSGGKDALDREVRKLERGREPPPSTDVEDEDGDDTKAP